MRIKVTDDVKVELKTNIRKKPNVSKIKATELKTAQTKFDIISLIRSEMLPRVPETSTRVIQSTRL